MNRPLRNEYGLKPFMQRLIAYVHACVIYDTKRAVKHEIARLLLLYSVQKK